ncbi:MAG: DNA primase [Gemmatimonadota bacterium]
MIAQHIVEEVRARADIVEIVSEHVQLKRAGKEYKANCPFHNERTPSFYVVPAKGFYKCFGCGESGDAFTFLMKRQGLSFTEAVRVVAAKVGLDIPAENEQRGDEPNRALYEVIAFAADFFQKQLWQEPSGERARTYLETRGIDRATAERFGLGYAPDAWRSLREAAHKHGIKDAVLLAAGLIKESEKKDEPYDRFRDRLIFPLAETTGRTVAFGGRVLRASEGAPKYLNSPETPVYQKGRMLYGLNWSRAAIRRDAVALVVEGYMDYVSLASAGIENLVAGMGTAMTSEQAALLARYTRKAVLLYDSDLAGLKATFRTGDALLQAGVEPLVATLPAGEDPDSLVRKGGAAALNRTVTGAIDVLERKLEILEQRGFFADIEGVRHALDRLLPTVRAAADPALKDIYVARVAERTGVRRETIEAALTSNRPLNAAFGRRSPQRSTPEQRGGDERRQPEPQAKPASESGAERELINFLLKDRSRLEAAALNVPSSYFYNPSYRELFEWLVAGNESKERLSPESQSALEVLERDQRDFGEGDHAFEDIVADLHSQALRRQKRPLQRILKRSEDQELREKAYREILVIDQQLKEIPQSGAKIGHKTTRYRKLKLNKPSPEQSE